jgi:hypothetical protein
MAETTATVDKGDGSLEHQARLEHAKQVQAHRASGPAKVVKQWIEVHKRVANEVGKVLLKSTVASGNTYSWYVGRETKSLQWLKEQQKAGVKIYQGQKVDEYGREGMAYKFPDEKKRR